METKEIIKELRKQKNLSAKEVAEGCEMSVGVYQKYESGERNLGVPALKALADFYNVSTDYLLGRTEIKAMAGGSPEEQLDVTAAEQEIIRRYTEFPENVRLLLLETIRKLVGLPEAADVRPVIVFTRCHRMKASAGAGFDLDNADEWRDVRIYDCPEAQDADFAVEVDGRSMEPDYLDGEIVFVKLADEVPVGSVGLFIRDGKGYIKERGEKCLISRNPEYENICGECKTVGLVIGKAETAV
ncbi:MAG: helix-turn-helix domain-containing protein [Ruminococcus sp.]|nr:helix-turn-helix domain-containing protein [Ruminococcus sp.]